MRYIAFLKVKHNDVNYRLPLFESSSKISCLAAGKRLETLLDSGTLAKLVETQGVPNENVLIGPLAFKELCNMYFPPMLPSSCFNNDGKLEVRSVSIGYEEVKEDVWLRYATWLLTSYLKISSCEVPNDIKPCIQPLL